MPWPTYLIINGEGVFRQHICEGRGLPLLYMLALLKVVKSVEIPKCIENVQGIGIQIWWRGGGLND